MATLEEHARKRDVQGLLITVMLTALSFVVGLFWNDAIRSGIESVIPIQERLSAKFVAALAVTIIVVGVAIALISSAEIGGRLSGRAARHLQQRVNQMESTMKKQAEMIKRQHAQLLKKQRQLAKKQEHLKKEKKKKAG